ncbi:hypothetical protein M4S82_16180, partial [Planococcus sp. MERTA32b]|nr:hypothetical protein [Planococcus sp. MER TA 32b]
PHGGVGGAVYVVAELGVGGNHLLFDVGGRVELLVAEGANGLHVEELVIVAAGSECEQRQGHHAGSE